MPEYLTPGVYVEEIESGSKPIEGVGTNTCAFVGYAKSGEINRPIQITSWTDFCKIFGEDENLILGALNDELGTPMRSLIVARRKTRKSLVEFARETLERSGKQPEEIGEFFQKKNIPVSPSPYLDGSYLAHSVQGYFANGGSRAYVIRIATGDDMKVINRPFKELEAKKSILTLGGLQMKALEAGKSGDDIQVTVKTVGEEGDAFILKVQKGDVVEEYGDEKAPLTPANIKEKVAAKKAPKLIEFVATDLKERPAEGLFTLTGGADKTSALAPLHEMHELARAKANEFAGDEAKRTGVRALAEVDDINMICVPDLMAGLFSPTDREQTLDDLNLSPEKIKSIRGAQEAVVALCEGMGDRMAILDPIPGLTPQGVLDYVKTAPWTCAKGQAAIYYPWIKVADPTRKGPNGEKYTMFCPPSGHVAGVWCRVVDRLGVHKAPANEGVMGAIELEWEVSHKEQGPLNLNGINCIRQFPFEGIKIWGARTLATVGNPSWKYVNVRRLFNFLEKSIARGMRWAVFEPNDDDLWARVRRNISAFLFVQWKEGKLFGKVPEEAFYVKCDRETNPREMIDQGRLYVEVGVNPVKPAEFVIIRMGQWDGGSETAEK